jgi:monoamine oxidase
VPRLDTVSKARVESLNTAFSSLERALDLHALKSSDLPQGVRGMPDGSYDTIVCGAGFAGVTAARELSRAGHNVLVLEARDRLGGRTWYKHDETHDRSLELGGTWVHWTQPHVFAEVTRYGLDLVESIGAAVPERLIYRSDDKLHNVWFDDGMAVLEEAIHKYCYDARDVLPRPYEPLLEARTSDIDPQSVQDRLSQLDVSPEQRDLLSALWSVFSSARCADSGLIVMLHWFALSLFRVDILFDATTRYKIKTGTRSLVEAMANDSDAEFRFSHPVASVDQEEETVTVRCTSDETFTARSVVVTAPVNTLGAVHFTPQLPPSKGNFIGEGQASRGSKLWLRVRGALPQPLVALGPDDEVLQYAHTEEVFDDGQFLVAFGNDGAAVDVNSVDSAQPAVRRLLGDDVELVATSGHDWLGDEYTRGTWPVLRPNQTTRYLPEIQRPEGRVFFAGSETANGWNGFIDGAIESGLRVARDVAAALGNERLAADAVS